MSKPLIIIADTNELYLQNLERKFLEEFDDQIELEIISDPVILNNVLRHLSQ